MKKVELVNEFIYKENKYREKLTIYQYIDYCIFMANRRLILNEEQIHRLITEGIISEVSTDDMDKKIAKALKNNKDLEKEVKKIVAKSVNMLFKTLWQRSGFFQSEIER